MKIIDVRVINKATGTSFETALVKVAKEFQEKGLLVTINNPHLVIGGRGGLFNYVAIVEGYKLLRDTKGALGSHL